MLLSSVRWSVSGEKFFSIGTRSPELKAQFRRIISQNFWTNFIISWKKRTFCPVFVQREFSRSIDNRHWNECQARTETLEVKPLSVPSMNLLQKFYNSTVAPEGAIKNTGTQGHTRKTYGSIWSLENWYWYHITDGFSHHCR